MNLNELYKRGSSNVSGVAGITNPSHLYLGYTPEQWQEFGASGGVLDGDYGIAGSTNSKIGLDAATGVFGRDMKAGDYVFNNNVNAEKSWFDDQDWGFNGMGGTVLGMGQLGLGLLGYLDNKKTAKLQRNLLQQQYDTNASELAHTQAARRAVEGAFGNTDTSKVPVYK